jgi:hypothetical protein
VAAAYDVTYVESRMFGTTLVYAAGRAGIPLAELQADTDKVTRAMAAADLNRQHRLWFPANAVWLDDWCDELAQFPNAAHDDQVDVLGYAGRVAITHWLPAQAPGVVERQMAAVAGGSRGDRQSSRCLTVGRLRPRGPRAGRLVNNP